MTAAKPEHREHSEYWQGYAAGWQDAYRQFCDAYKLVREAQAKRRKPRRKK